MQISFLNLIEQNNYIDVEEFNDNVIFTFDSDENVQKNYQGNYGLRLTDD